MVHRQYAANEAMYPLLLTLYFYVLHNGHIYHLCAYEK